MAGELGFEPRLNDPESFVLPLHYSPVFEMTHYPASAICMLVFDMKRGISKLGHGFPQICTAILIICAYQRPKFSYIIIQNIFRLVKPIDAYLITRFLTDMDGDDAQCP